MLHARTRAYVARSETRRQQQDITQNKHSSLLYEDFYSTCKHPAYFVYRGSNLKWNPLRESTDPFTE